jgi:hypothetical protein
MLSRARGRADRPAVGSEAVRDLAEAAQTLRRARAFRAPRTREDTLKDIAPTVEFQGVKIVAESERALCCRIAGRDHWIPPGRFLEGTSVAHFGDRGTVVVTSEFADTQGLLLNAFPPG